MKNIAAFIGDFRPFLKRICSTYDRVWISRRRKLNSEVMFSAILSQTLDRDSYNYRIIYDKLLEAKVGLPQSFSASSYSKARKKLPFELFTDVSHWVYKFHQIPQNRKWLGMNVFAIDGTRIDLPKELEAEGFDCPTDEESEFPQAHATVVFDLQKGMIYDSILSQHTDERGSAKILMNSLPDNSLLICDRGFTGFGMLYEAEKLGVKLLVRMTEYSAPTELQDFINSDETDEIIDITLNITKERKLLRRGYQIRPVTVRAIKYWIGATRFVAITTLLDDEITANDLASMYWCRWDIEECFKIKKEKLRLETFRSKHLEGVLQEFWATQLIYNLGRAVAMCVEGEKTKLEARVEISLFGILKLFRTHLLNLIQGPKVSLKGRIMRLEWALNKIRRKFRGGRRYPRHFRIQT
jgi:hypothetical protein